jgi:large repetitive protein
MAGADGAVAGTGIYLHTATNISLTRMHISSCANHGIYGVSVRGLVLDHLITSGNIGTSNSGEFTECSVRMIDQGGDV